MQGAVAVTVTYLDIGPVLQQDRHRRQVGVGGGAVQGGAAEGEGGVRGLALPQPSHHLECSVKCTLVLSVVYITVVFREQ